MKILLPVLLFLSVFALSFTFIRKQLTKLDLPVYAGNDLGVNYTAGATSFKVWSPQANAVKLRLFTAGQGGDPIQTITLQKSKSGTWAVKINEDLKNTYYTFQMLIDGAWGNEAPDIYAKAVGVNGKRGMVIDLQESNPEGWDNDKKPRLKGVNDIILYELHIRDLSADPNSGIRYAGKFLGLTETGTHNAEGAATGIDHIKKLGVTHVHLLPSFDFNSIDETDSEGKYNWGYDPQNYNVPEGSYATDPYNGLTRVKEFKKMVQNLHSNGLRVVLDVVYNHTSGTRNSNFTQFAPGYFYRHNKDGSYSDATATGNETASEKAMMRKFMIESVIYWAKEYHLDGFRFDLMAVHDIETMNMISDTLHKIDPTIFIYGEGWDAADSPMAREKRLFKENIAQGHHIAAFNDDIRDGIRGLKEGLKGFASGGAGVEAVKFGIAAAIQHPQISYKLLSHSKKAWADQPYQVINYASCHDDHTLFDRFKAANPEATDRQLLEMNKLSNAIVLTSQGIPFILSGEEFLRTKQGVSNSYNKPDAINQLDWSRKSSYKDLVNYYQDMVALRKNHPAFRMPTADMIRKHLEFVPAGDPLVIAYLLKDHANGDRWRNILVLFNGNFKEKEVSLPKGTWTIVANPEGVREGGISAGISGKINLPASAAYILMQ